MIITPYTILKRSSAEEWLGGRGKYMPVRHACAIQSLVTAAKNAECWLLQDSNYLSTDAFKPRSSADGDWDAALSILFPPASSISCVSIWLSSGYKTVSVLTVKVAIFSAKQLSCSTKSMVGLYVLRSFSICIREYMSI